MVATGTCTVVFSTARPISLAHNAATQKSGCAGADNRRSDALLLCQCTVRSNQEARESIGAYVRTAELPAPLATIESSRASLQPKSPCKTHQHRTRRPHPEHPDTCRRQQHKTQPLSSRNARVDGAAGGVCVCVRAGGFVTRSCQRPGASSPPLRLLPPMMRWPVQHMNRPTR